MREIYPTKPVDVPIEVRQRRNQILAIVAETPVYRVGDDLFTAPSFGCIIDALAVSYRRVLLCLPTFLEEPQPQCDYRLSCGNVILVPQPPYSTSIGALKSPAAIAKAYSRVLSHADCVFVRGMIPYVALFYLLVCIHRHNPVHWLVGNPVALLKSHRRAGRMKDALSMAYALQDRFFVKLGRRLSGGAFVCNGRELSEVYRSPRTQAVVSSTITEQDIYVREDTCAGSNINILFVGFVRPEKGVEYLIEALPKLKVDRPWSLTMVGPWEDFQQYKSLLDSRIAELGLGDRIHWRGYVSGGSDLWTEMRCHDVLVLPTLSEGTPRVLVEARANSLPIIATRVGGIPTSVTDGVDGILVPPKDPDAIADAINRIVSDSGFRRSLINDGLDSARTMTINTFVDLVVGELS